MVFPTIIGIGRERQAMTVQEICHLPIVDLAEVAIMAAHGQERLGLMEADNGVGLCAQFGEAGCGGNRQGDNDLFGPPLPDQAKRRAGGRPGCHPVIDHDGRPARQRFGRKITEI